MHMSARLRCPQSLAPLCWAGPGPQEGADPCLPVLPAGPPPAVLQFITSCLSSRFQVAGQLELLQEDKQEGQLPAEIPPLTSLTGTQLRS